MINEEGKDNVGLVIYTHIILGNVNLYINIKF